MNRSCFAMSALLGLSLLSVNVANGQLLSDEYEALEPRPKTYSMLLDMMGDCAHGAIDHCQSVQLVAKAEKASDSADAECEAEYGAGNEDASVDAIAATETRQPAAEEGAYQDEAAPQSGDDYLADDNLTTEDAVNQAFDRAIAPITADEPSDYADYSEYQENAAAPSNAAGSEESAYDGNDGYDGEWNAESPAVPIDEEPSAAADVAEDSSLADSADADLAESYLPIDTHADDVTVIESSRFDRRTLLGVAGLLDRLGVALQNVSRELTSLASKKTDSINR